MVLKKFGNEFQFALDNRDTYSGDAHADLTFSDGSYLKHWRNYTSFWTSNFVIQGQRFFSNDTAAIDNSFQIDFPRPDSNEDYNVKVLSNDNYVVVWDGKYTYDPYLFGQMFMMNGTKIGGVFNVNTTPKTSIFQASIAAFNNGGFVVLWSVSVGDYYNFDVFTQVFNFDAEKVGKEVQLNPILDGFHVWPSMALFPNNDFVVEWSNKKDSEDQSLYALNVYAQVLNADGTKKGEALYVTDEGGFFGQHVATLSEDKFVVVWNRCSDSKKVCHKADSWSAMFIRWFPRNTFCEDCDPFPDLIKEDDYECRAVFDHGRVRDLYGQVFDIEGNRLGDEFKINNHTRAEGGVQSINVSLDGLSVSWVADRWDTHDLYAQEFKFVAGDFASGTDDVCLSF